MYFKQFRSFIFIYLLNNCVLRIWICHDDSTVFDVYVSQKCGRFIVPIDNCHGKKIISSRFLDIPIEIETTYTETFPLIELSRCNERLLRYHKVFETWLSLRVAYFQYKV